MLESSLICKAASSCGEEAYQDSHCSEDLSSPLVWRADICTVDYAESDRIRWCD